MIIIVIINDKNNYNITQIIKNLILSVNRIRIIMTIMKT